MERWQGVLHVPLHGSHCRVAASLYCSPTAPNLAVPSRNAILFMGDRAEGTGNEVIDKLSRLENVASILVSKLGSTVNAWVVEASKFVGPFAVYKEFLSSTTPTGEPTCYDPQGLPAAISTTSLLANCLEQVKVKISHEWQSTSPLDMQSSGVTSFKRNPQTVVLGFSKGGVVVNQLLTELALLNNHVNNSNSKSIKYDPQHELRGKSVDFLDITEEQEKMYPEHCERHSELNLLIPHSSDGLLKSIEEFHYVDVGLNCPGAYQTNPFVIERIGKIAESRKTTLRIVLHGTPRQWADCNRPWISSEKETLIALLQEEARKHKENKLQISEKLYFADRFPSLQMHFEIIEHMVLS